MSNELRKEQVEYLFLDLEWNQPCGTTELADREASITKRELMAEAKKSQERKREMEQSGQYINSQDKADTKRKC